MRKIEQTLVFVLWALLVISPSGCGDDERADDGNEPDDTEADDAGADAGETDTENDAGSDSGAIDDSSGVRGYTSCGLTCPTIPGEGNLASGVDFYACDTAYGPSAGSGESNEDGYYEITLPPGVYIVRFDYNGSWWECSEDVSPVVVGEGIWVDLDVYLICADFD
jgi:hypothetical protein